MGVDIWVRRRSVAADVAATPSVAPATSVAPVVSVAPIAAVAEPLHAALSPTVALDCFSAPGIVIVGELLDPLDKRIAQDIVLAVAGAAAPLQHAAFRWPLTQTGDAGITAARNAYRGFLRGQTERAAARWLLLLGAAATALLEANADGDDSAAHEERTQRAHEERTLRLPAASALRADPLAKQRLWLSVSQNDRS